jgi:hypothetical protein
MSTDKQKQNAENALKEAAERRAQEEEQAKKRAEKQAEEIGGRDGPEATRFGDWEKNGIISDF